MRIYSRADEERVRLQASVRDWTRSGLLNERQRQTIEADLRTNLARTNTMLRAGLALFTAIVVAASVALVAVTFDVSDRLAIAVLLLAGSLVCYGVAEWLVRTLRLYRYGVEETLAVAAVALGAIGTAFLMPRDASFQHAMLVTLLIGAAGGFLLYRRFGFVYAAVGAMACGAAAVFQLGLGPASERILAAAGLAGAALLARARRSTYGDDHPADEYAIVYAAAFVGMYLAINLKIFTPWDVLYVSGRVERGFYWLTYVLTWLVPAVGLWAGIREKERHLIDAGLAAALATLVTNKPYLGWIRRPWDPILLGVLLIAVAVLLRRWLIAGPAGQRDGFTPLRILASDSEAIARLGTLTVAVPRAAPTSLPETPPSAFTGGRSGGAGGGGEF